MTDEQLQAEVLKGLKSKYQDRFRRMVDLRSTPGASAWLLSRIGHYVTLAARDYINNGGTEDGLVDAQMEVANERRRFLCEAAHEPLWSFISDDED